MESNTKLPNKHFYLIIFSCAVIIFCECLQVLMRVKDSSNYTVWLENMGEQITFEVYMAIQMSYFFMKVIIPVMLGIYAYLSLVKVRIGKLFVFMWTVLLVGGLGYTVIEWDLYSPFYYFKLLAYGIGIGTILNLLKVIKEQKII